MSELIAIGYPDETTAGAAAGEMERLASDLVVEPDAIAAIRRDIQGRFHVTTTHHEVATGTLWGVFWGALFGVLFFIPVLGIVVGTAMGAIIGLVTKLGVNESFQRQVREMLRPGTSALFIVAEKVTLDKTIDALKRFGGTVLKTSLSKDIEAQLQAALEPSMQVPVGATAR